MSTEQYGDEPRERAIFLQALDKNTTEERAAFLDGACGGDDELRAKVEELLANHLDDSFLETSAIDRRTTVEQPPTVPITEEPGSRIDRYKLLQRIGEGGFGVVYVAEQQEPVRRRAALKILKLGMDTKQVVARFEAERQALALMNHPNIAKVFDAGATETGRPYFVMELVRGIKITDYCDRNNLSTRERLDLFVLVCDAIQHAHQKGVIHRDIKPSNVLVTVNNGKPVPKVIDFGIAKATAQQRLTDKTLYTAFEQFIGTPAYVSPEQAEMTSLDIDTRSDVYALGVLLYELLTGKTPFETQDLLKIGLIEMRRVIREQEPPRPSTRLGTLLQGDLATTAQHRRAEPPKLIHLVRGDLDWIVMKALEKDRTRRYESANGLALDVERHINHEPVTARPPSAAYRAQKFIRRHKVTVTAAAAVGLALVLGLVVSTWFLVLAEQARGETEKQRQAAEAAKQRWQRTAYASDLNLAAQELETGKLDHARLLLDGQKPDSNESDLRGWEWRYLWQECRSEAMPMREATDSTRAVWSLSVSHDGKWLALVESGVGLFSLWDLELRCSGPRLPAGEGLVCATFSPRDSLLAFSNESVFESGPFEHTLHLWNGDTPQLFAGPRTGNCIALAFSEDGNTLVSVTRDPDEVTLWRVPEGALLKTWSVRAGSDFLPRFAMTKDCRIAAVTGFESPLCLIDLSSGAERWRATPNSGSFTSLEFSPDGKVLVSAEGVGVSSVRFWDVTNGKELGEPLKGAFVKDMLFLPEDKTLLVASGDQHIHIWDVSDMTSVRQQERPLRGHTDEVFSLALLPDRRTLVSGAKNGEIYLWDIAAPRHSREPLTLPTKVTDWCFGTDSNSILVCDDTGRVTEWRGPDFDEPRLLFVAPAINSANYGGGCFSEGGRWFAAGADGVVQVWDTYRGEVVRVLEDSASPARPWKFLDDEWKLITLGTGQLGGVDQLWDVARSEVLHSWPTPPGASGAAVAPDQRWWVRVGSRGMCSIRSLDGGTARIEHLEISQARQPAISPDGTLLAVPSWSNYVHLWDTTTWEQVRTLSGFLLACNSVAFSEDGTRLITGSSGLEAVRIWDTKSWRNLLTLPAGEGHFQPARISPDGNILGARDQQRSLHLWLAPSGAEIQAAEEAQAGGF